MKLPPSVNVQLLEFFYSKNRNMWLEDHILSVYVRKGFHIINEEIIDTIDIANISTINSKYKGKGYFRSFMLAVEGLGIAVYVENIHNQLLLDMLVKHNYEILENKYASCAYKMPPS
jgi:hypothetical protein